MNKNITRVIPSESLKGSKVNEFGNPISDTRKKKPTFVDGKFNGEIYEVGKKYQQAYTERNTFEPVDRVVSTSIKRLEELKDEKKVKLKERVREELLFSYEFREKNKQFKNDYEIQVSSCYNNYNMKMLKIWKMYWSNEEGWKHTKDGFVMPIKEGKKMLRELLKELDGK